MNHNSPVGDELSERDRVYKAMENLYNGGRTTRRSNDAVTATQATRASQEVVNSSLETRRTQTVINSRNVQFQQFQQQNFYATASEKEDYQGQVTQPYIPLGETSTVRPLTQCSFADVRYSEHAATAPDLRPCGRRTVGLGSVPLPSLRRVGPWACRLFFAFLALVLVAMVHILLSDILGTWYNRACGIAVGWIQVGASALFQVFRGRGSVFPSATGDGAQQANGVLCPTNPAVSVVRAREGFVVPPVVEGLDSFITTSLAPVGDRDVIDPAWEDKRLKTIHAAKVVGPRFSELVGEFEGETVRTMESLARFRDGLALLKQKPRFHERFLARLRVVLRMDPEPKDPVAELGNILQSRRDVLSRMWATGPRDGMEGRGESQDVDAATQIQEVRTGVCSIAEERGRSLLLMQPVDGNAEAVGGDSRQKQQSEDDKMESRKVAMLKASCRAMVHLSSRHQRMMDLAFKERSFLAKTVWKLGDVKEKDDDMVWTLESLTREFERLLKGYYHP